MEMSLFGQKFSGHSGIVELMDDLGSAIEENPDMILMGGGNPGRIPEVDDYFRQRLQSVIAEPGQWQELFGLYQPPAGDPDYRREMAAYLRREFGWSVTRNNIAIANGSQSAYFVLLNLFAGAMPDGGNRTVHMPLSPEYLGYADAGLSDRFFSATQPQIELLDNRLFKYRVDFSRLDPGEDAGVMCVSRPTNPTGNVLTDEEVEHLHEVAQSSGIPLIIDAAYGQPFPNIQFCETRPFWNEDVILTLSLSKLGLPGVRTGIIVAREDIIEAYSTANGIVNLACGNLGPMLTRDLVSTGQIGGLVKNAVNPFYREKARVAVDEFRCALQGLPFRIHKPEGAFFLWLWFEDLPISSDALYRRLKKRGVLVVPGHHCFFGLPGEWAHRNECIRVSYVQDFNTVRQGIALIASEIRDVFSGG